MNERFQIPMSSLAMAFLFAQYLEEKQPLGEMKVLDVRQDLGPRPVVNVDRHPQSASAASFWLLASRFEEAVALGRSFKELKELMASDI